MFALKHTLGGVGFDEQKVARTRLSAVCCGTGKKTFQIVLLQERLENKCNPSPLKIPR